jgi:hypothetical protein
MMPLLTTTCTLPTNIILGRLFTTYIVCPQSAMPDSHFVHLHLQTVALDTVWRPQGTSARLMTVCSGAPAIRARPDSGCRRRLFCAGWTHSWERANRTSTCHPGRPSETRGSRCCVYLVDGSRSSDPVQPLTRLAPVMDQTIDPAIDCCRDRRGC